MNDKKKVGRPKKSETQEERTQSLNHRREQQQANDRKRRETHNQQRRNKYSERFNSNASPLGCLLNVESVETLDIGVLEQRCENCKGLSFKNEQGRSKNSCCHQGKIKLSPLQEYPEALKNLLLGNDERSSHFRKTIRIYNNAFAFASFNFTNYEIPGNGPYCMKIIGEANRRVTTSLFSKGNPRYGQIYIYDDDETLIHRCQENIRDDILLEIQHILKYNPYAVKYKELHTVYKETGSDTVCLKFLNFSSDDTRRYNLPTCQSIAAIITTHDGCIPQKVDVMVFPKKEKECDFVQTTSPHCDPMLFPLLFPKGENGWSYLMKTEKMKNISPLQFYSYRLTVRDGEFNPIFVSGRLTQQYIINCYLTVEAQRLNYIKYNQNQLRSECYQGLVDHVKNSEANISDPVRLGNILILPSTYQGSARSMQQLYQDAMAICRKVGRPDLFITMTCNPKWSEITRYLRTMPAGITANDIPHFTTRLFYQKALSLINDLETVFGKIRAYVYTIEFQKRGLPHMHLLVTLQNKLLTADDVDRFICAEIPERSTPSLWYKVVKHMLHGPHVPGLPCYDVIKKCCKKNFPKEFTVATDMSNTGFPKYRRRNNINQMHTYHGKTNGKIVKVDNSMVVPYNPYLLMKYDCHINVEYCASIMGIKYIHKYIHKGHDRARIKITRSSDSENNEIQDYLDTRYLSATECAWRLFELPLHGRSHAVERLPIHLPGMNRILFTEGKESDAIEANTHSKLTAYFQLNKEDEAARKLKYEDIPLVYRWVNGKKCWQKRVNNTTKIVSRLIAVSSKSIELFHLKLLLRNVTGATCFEDFLKVNGLQHTSFKEAATAMGLICNELEMVEVMAEACSTLMPRELRHFFVYILLGCENINAEELWDKFRYSLSEDINEEQALLIINDLLEKENTCLENFGLQKPDCSNQRFTENIDFDYHHNEYLKMHKLLNPEQAHAFQCIIDSIRMGTTKNCFYIDGPGGSGKTFLYSCIIHYAMYHQKRIFTIAWTGIAAILLPFGKTAHKSFQLPINIEEKSTLYWSKKTKQIIVETDIFIWDEASMIPAAALESIDTAMRDTCCSSVPFGGKILLLGGDFRQVLPVVKRAGRTQIVNSSIKRSNLWNYFSYFYLSKNMRVTEPGATFSDWLLDIGNGKVQTLTVNDDIYTEDIVSKMYLNKDPSVFLTQAILTPRNDDVSMINKKILEIIPGEMHHCLGIDKVTARGTDSADEITELSYPLEYVNTLTPSGFPPQKLSLKVGAIVMLIRNLCASDGLCNGTRLIVRGIQSRMLRCEILTGEKIGNTVFIPRIKLDSSADTELPFVLHRIQFPVRLSFAMTINKSQGQSFERIGLFLMDDHPIFSHGQLYVALSRCKSFNGISVQLSKENSKREIRNIVYSEILK